MLRVNVKATNLLGRQKMKIFFLPIFLLMMTLCACQEIPPIERARIASPDEKFDAVIVEWPTNATSDFIFGLVLLPHNEKISKKITTILVSSDVKKDQIQWIDSRYLKIKHMRHVRIHSFTNRWYPPEVLQGNGAGFVEIELFPEENN